MIAMDHNFFFLFYSAGFSALSLDPGFSVCVCFEYFVCRLLGFDYLRAEPMGHTLATENGSWLVEIGPAISQHKRPSNRKTVICF